MAGTKWRTNNASIDRHDHDQFAERSKECQRKLYSEDRRANWIRLRDYFERKSTIHSQAEHSCRCIFEHLAF